MLSLALVSGLVSALPALQGSLVTSPFAVSAEPGPLPVIIGPAPPRHPIPLRPTPSITQDAWSDEDLRAAFEAAPENKQRGLIDYLRMDLEHADTFQRTLMNHALETSDRDAGGWENKLPEMWFDPHEHAPGQIIPRKLIDPEDAAYKSVRKWVDRVAPPRLLQSGWEYDWGTGDVVRLENEDDAVRHFENALIGFPPELDLAEALILRQLDDGSQREALAAFEHLYTDRVGNAFPAITLYDVWSSGMTMEMPDVDTLGIVHNLMKKVPKSWVAPISPTEHDKLYATIGEFFVPAKKHRGVRSAIARTYLSDEPVYNDGYTSGHYDMLHAFWEDVSSDIENALKDVPDADEADKFLSKWMKKLKGSEKLLEGARNRRWQLGEDRKFVRKRLVALMIDMQLIKATE